MKTRLLLLCALALAACSKGADNGSTNEAAVPAAPDKAFAALTGDAAAGEAAFVQCRLCHTVEPGKNLIGPSLHQVVGRKAGSLPGFTYSTAMKNSGITWTGEQLYRFLAAPAKTVPGTRMAFAGLKDPQRRADLIAYLETK
ncbi:c-type cytochrome [Sphingomonas sp. MAH-20]|uniref:C-type cytochrome n=1 Tax=Sphingomonas horti TaxID=2682842 RepID=A0A6I4J1B4_9SPHN|nr:MULTISPECIES: cytochrome c family protein [Sphingomonas]MBA2919530.1 cytochrome c family protein [Sphingomonas sp. CGMCC 1.13658]MVO78410.1 c-type cytochrome [Sphingomonas horti]